LFCFQKKYWELGKKVKTPNPMNVHISTILVQQEVMGWERSWSGLTAHCVI
jgi:hypothetical protein